MGRGVVTVGLLQLSVTLTLLLPLLAAIVMVGLPHQPRTRRAIARTWPIVSFILAVFNLASTKVSGPTFLNFGNWPSSYGIEWRVDLLAAMLVCATHGVALTAAWLRRGGRVRYEDALLQLLFAGVTGAFYTNDLFNLFVWFEVLLLSSFGLIAMGQQRQALEGTFKYAVLNLVASAMFLGATGITYHSLGTLNLTLMKQAITQGSSPYLWLIAQNLLLVAFAAKAAAFPLFGWLPGSYHVSKPMVNAVIGGLLTKVGVYALIRWTSLVGLEENWLFIVVGAATMLVGVFGASTEFNLRKILSVHIISQVGYMIWALGFGTSTAVAGVIYYLLHNIVVKTCLFYAAAIAEGLTGEVDVRRMGGIKDQSLPFAWIFLLAAMALAGLPPLSGFWAKLLLLKEGVGNGFYISAGLAIFVSVLTLYSMIKIWSEGFWKPVEESPTPLIANRERRYRFWPLYLMVGVVVAMGIAVEPFYKTCVEAALQLEESSGTVVSVSPQSALRGTK